MKSNITVFICSTYSDLSKERESVMDAIRRLQLAHDSMEFFGARSNQPIETCLAEVRRSNILIVIIGHRYGSIVSELGISYSEAEYNEAIKYKKPCLVYMRDENVPILPKDMERDPHKLDLLEKWKEKLNSRHTVANFQGNHDIAVQVAADLGRTISDLETVIQEKEDAQKTSPVKIIEEISDLLNEGLKKGVTEGALLSSIRRAIFSTISDKQNLGSRVFLSYASSDIEIVRKVAKGLSDEGLQVWFDESSLKVGDNWIREVERGLDSANFILFFISPDSVKEGWAQKELQIALMKQVYGESGATILPILLKPAEVPPLLRDIQWLDMTNGDVKKAIKEICETINSYSIPQLSQSNQKPESSKFSGKKISYNKVIAILEEERGVVGKSAKRLGISARRLYRLLNYYNIQPGEYK